MRPDESGRGTHACVRHRTVCARTGGAGLRLLPSALHAARLCRPRRGICVPRFVSDPDSRLLPERLLAAAVAVSHGLARRPPPQRLPARAAAEGSYTRLRTTFPALSPVAWSTFATGVSPAKHNIFDFLDRSLKTYLPQLSSARVGKPAHVLCLGRLRIPLSRTPLELRRKSQPFWKILGRQGIGCTILRVPITFPPEKFDGRLLSAMCTPDLKGTQGSFSQFTTRVERPTYENGSRYPLKRVADGFTGEIEGPTDTFLESTPTLRIPFRVARRNGAFELQVEGRRCALDPGEYRSEERSSCRSRDAVARSIPAN